MSCTTSRHHFFTAIADLRTNSQTMDVPNAGGHSGVNKRGFLQKLSSRSFPYIPHPWKRRYCILVKGQLFYYEREDSKGADKGSGVINLEYYDQVVEASSKDCKKATNVFVLTSQDRSFFDPGRHLFSADTPHEMSEWMRHLKKAIEQIRNNHRTTSPASTATASAAFRAGHITKSHALAGSSSNPSSPRPAAPAKLEGVAPKTETGRGGAAAKEGGAAGKDRGRKKDTEEAEKVRKKRGVGEDAAVSQAEDNKENLEDWTGNKERKQAYPDNSLRRRKANPSSRSMDENSLGSAATKGSLNPERKKLDASLDSGSGHSSLGRKKPDRPDLLIKSGDSSKPGGVRGAGQDYMVFGSLGRQASYEKLDAAGSVLGNTGGHVERKKRKADDDEVEMEAPQTSSQLENVTKHRVKGPAGRRMPQNRRSQHPVMKHRASSLSALTHSEENTQEQDDSSASFVPWLNRSLDLLGEDDLKAPCRNSQPALGYIYSDEDAEEADDRLYEYNIGFHGQNLSFEENNGLYVQEGPFVQQNSEVFNALNLSSGGIPPPLPPRMESRMEFQTVPQTSIPMQNQFQMHQHQQLQQQLHQMQYQATLQQQNQMCSPFGTAQSELMSERDQKMHNRKSQPFDEMGDLLMTRSLTNELFISSYSEENSCDASNPHLHQSQEQQCRQQQFKMESAPQQQKQIRPKLGSKNNGQKSRRPMSQPDFNRFTVAVRNLQKHVVELDQAVNEITKEVEDSKVDLGSISSSLAAIKKDKERLNDAISIVSQEACKVKEQVAASLKEAEKLQKTATAALVVAEKAKVDQQHLKTEYEVMLRELKSTIEGAKREAQKNLSAKSSPFICKRMEGEDKGDGGGGDTESEEDDVIYQEKKDHRKKSKESARMTSTKSRENKNNGSSSKSSGYQSFFSRPSSIISGLTNRASLVKSTSSIDSPDKESKDKSPKIDSKASGKMLQKDKQISRSFKETTSSEVDKSKKILRHLSDDFPMMDETGSPRALSPISSSPDITQSEHDNFDSNYSLLKSTSSPTVPIRPGVLNLTPQSPEAANKACSASASPDSPTRPSSPFDVPRLHLNGRATSPINFPLHRPGSTPGPLNRQGSMTTVPEDRAVDLRTFDNRPTDPPPPPPTNRIFAISRQSSTPNISLQKTVPATIQRQHSLGVVHEENKNPISRQSSVMSMPDDRLIVDQTLTMSPTPSMMSFSGSWSTTSLNRPDSAAMVNGAPDCSSSVLLASSSPKGRPKGALDQVAGGVLAGSSLQIGVVCSLDQNNDEPPLATSSLKKRKKVKKDVVDV